MISEFDRQHVGDIIGELPPQQRYTNFTAWLLRLIAKADMHNRELLRRVYPDEVEAFEDWFFQRPRQLAGE